VASLIAAVVIGITLHRQKSQRDMARREAKH
jgi:hypothetical protein